MDTSEKNIRKARRLLDELYSLEEALEVLGNYDVEVYGCFRTCHNNNRNYSKEVKVRVPSEIKNEMKSFIENRIVQIKAELEEL